MVLPSQVREVKISCIACRHFFRTVLEMRAIIMYNYFRPLLFNTFCDDHNPIWIRTTLVIVQLRSLLCICCALEVCTLCTLVQGCRLVGSLIGLVQ